MNNNWISRKEAHSQRHHEVYLRELGEMVSRHLIAILVCIVLLGGVGFGLAKFVITPQYSASTQILVNQRHTTNGQVFDNQQADIQMVNTYKKIITNHQMLNLSRKQLAAPDNSNVPAYQLSMKELKRAVSVKTSQNSQIFILQAKAHNAQESSVIANTVTDVFKHRIKRIMGFDNVTITSRAVTPSKQSFPNVKLFTLGGAILGLLVGVAYAVFRENN